MTAEPVSTSAQPARAKPAEGLGIFEQFCSVRPEPSGFAAQSAVLWIMLDAVQRLLGVSGDFLDAGVGSGAASLLGLLLTGPEERALGLDARPSANVPQLIGRLPGTVAARWSCEQARLDELPAEAARRGRFRWIHIDANLAGPVEADGLMAQIKRAAALLGPHGVLVLDDFFQASVPDVTTAVYRLLLGGAPWRVLMAGFNKVYLVRADSHAAYREALEREAAAYLAPFGDFLLSPVALAGHAALAVRGVLRSGGSAVLEGRAG